MSGPRWTPDQSEAITERGCSLLVSAAAGSGKTAVLVERIIKRITDEANPADIDRLLVVTFTKAAAAEMRERIGAAIARELNKNPDSRHLNRQLTLLNRASITTLHSFCLEVLKQYFYSIDLDPGFRVADDGEASLLRLEALEELFEELYSSGSEEFHALVDAYGGNKDDVRLQDIVLRLREFSSSNPWPEVWLRKLADGYRHREGLPLEESDWGREILSWLELHLTGCRDKLNKAVNISLMPGGPDVYCENLRDDMRIIDDLLNAARISWGELYSIINSAEFSKLKSCRSLDVDEMLKSRVQASRDQVKKTVNSIRADLFSRPPEELGSDLNRLAPLVAALGELVIEFGNRYSNAKIQRGLVDFADLEHYCLRILLEEGSRSGKAVPSAVACELREYFDEVFVDEYQDINEVQETVLRLVSRDGSSPNRFMVGDVKQSIYGFRLADPTLFMQKYTDYPREKGMPERGIDLRQNFRSRGEIIDAANFIFRRIMTVGLSGISYDEKAELVCGAQFPHATEGISCAAGPVELHLLDKKGNDDGFERDREQPGFELEDADTAETVVDEGEELDALQKEACLVGKRIADMVRGHGGESGAEFCIYDKTTGNYRPVRYGDIVVLLRTTRNTANVFIDEFRKLGIPAYAELGTGYFEAVEVDTIMSLLRIIDNPRQDIPLTAVLRSPVVGLNAAELAAVRLRKPGAEYYDCVRTGAELGETPADLKIRGFLAGLEKWRTMARQGPLSELIWQLYNETGYYVYVGGMPGGSQRQANLRALHDRARQYEATCFRGLFRFLRFIEKFQESGSDLGAARALGENEDVVRIISIHKSKGLEFPVVITAGLGKQFNLNDLREKALLHKTLGLGLPVVDLNNCLTYQTVAQYAIKKRLHMDLLAEEMRILYVALTRAKEKLILVGSVSDLPKNVSRWCELASEAKEALPDSVIADARTFLDWIGPVLARHRDGRILWETGTGISHPQGRIFDDISRFMVSLHKEVNYPAVSHEPGADSKDLLEAVRRLEPIVIETGDETIERMLNWQYPYLKIAGRPAKASVTELKRRFASEEDDVNQVIKHRHVTPRRPAFLSRSSGLSPSERGSAMHLVMQHMKFREGLTRDEIKAEISGMIGMELLTPEQAEAVDTGQIMGFFESEIGKRSVRADVVRKEIPFTLAVQACRIYAGLDENCGEEVLLQGVIDCLVTEGDGYILIDYKTDTAPADEILKNYQAQINLYAEAVETIFKKPVTEKYLYLFHHALAVRYD